MSAQAFEHYRRAGQAVCLPLTARPVIDRITPRNQRTTYKGEGVCLGARVRMEYAYDMAANQSRDMVGQVWSRGRSPYRVGGGSEIGWWVVADSGRAWFAREECMDVLSHCTAPEELPIANQSR